MKSIKIVVILLIVMTLTFAGFFYAQNKQDIAVYFKYKEQFEYSSIQKNCKPFKGSHFDCILKLFKDYTSQVSLTGINFGMHTIFDLIEEDKKKNKFYQDSAEKDVVYSLYYLQLNNLVLHQVRENFRGLESLYGAYISALDEFLPKAYKFSNNLIAGLKGVDGLTMIKDPSKQAEYSQMLDNIIQVYNKEKDENQKFLENEGEKLRKKFTSN
jgi:hypothetical protein